MIQTSVCKYVNIGLNLNSWEKLDLELSKISGKKYDTEQLVVVIMEVSLNYLALELGCTWDDGFSSFFQFFKIDPSAM